MTNKQPAPESERPEPHPFLIFAVVAAVVVIALVIVARVAAGTENRAGLTEPVTSQPGSEGSENESVAEVPVLTETAPALVEEAVEAAAPPAAPEIRPPIAPSAPQPYVGAKAFAIVDRACGALAFGKAEHERLAPASVTKIITAMVVERLAHHDAMVDISVSGEQMARRGSSVMGLVPNTQMSVIDLLYGLFLPSGNDAALALAQYIGAGDVGAFVQEMNNQATSLQMRDTHFTNPHGLDDPGLYSSAFDMAMAGRALLEDPDLAQISVTSTYQPDWSGPVLKNGNKLLQLYPGSFGVKIGFTTKAQQTIVAAAERDGRQIIVSVFGSEDRYSDTIALFDWAFSSIPSRCPG